MRWRTPPKCWRSTRSIGISIPRWAVLGSQGSLLDADTRERVQRPVGQWNSVRVVNQNGTVTTYINGALIGQGTHAFTATGYVIFQLEGVAMRFRSIRIRALPDQPAPAGASAPLAGTAPPAR